MFPLGRLLSLDCPADPDTWADANNGCGLLCSCTLLCPLGPTPPPFTGGCTSTNVGGSGIQTPSFVFGSDGSVFTASGVLNPVPGQVDRPGTGGGSDLTNADKAFIAAMIAAAALGAVLAVEVHHPQRRVGSGHRPVCLRRRRRRCHPRRDQPAPFGPDAPRWCTGSKADQDVEGGAR